MNYSASPGQVPMNKGQDQSAALLKWYMDMMAKQKASGMHADPGTIAPYVNPEMDPMMSLAGSGLDAVGAGAAATGADAALEAFD